MLWNKREIWFQNKEQNFIKNNNSLFQLSLFEMTGKLVAEVKHLPTGEFIKVPKAVSQTQTFLVQGKASFWASLHIFIHEKKICEKFHYNSSIIHLHILVESLYQLITFTCVKILYLPCLTSCSLTLNFQ